MRLALFTNIPSHYQISLGHAFADRLGSKFTLVCWESGTEERRKLGWVDTFEEEWLIKAWTSDDEAARALQTLRSADVVVWGYAPSREISERVTKGKLTFCYTERLFKRGRWRLFDPRVLRAVREKYKLSDGKSHHLLAVGPYCAEDFRLIRVFQGRMWRWGYFPKVPRDNKTRDSNIEPFVLWAGRMVHWKRVNLLLSAAAWARTQGGLRFRLQLIGYGPEEERLRVLAARLKIMDICNFQPPQSPEQVGKTMESANIFVLPSDRNEGWGVVVNEAMSRGCCVIGSKSAGSVPWLISDGINGFMFEGRNVENLGRVIHWCLNNPERIQEIGIAGQKTISELWSPVVAVDRLLSLCDALDRGKTSSFQDGGPCSPIY